MVLVIACANAMNLMIAHSLRRHQEVAVRLALGAGRGRVIRLLVVQSVLLALGGGLAAIIIGHWTAQGLWRLLLPDGRAVPSSIDPLTIAVTASLAVIVGLIAGLPPAWQTTRPGLIDSLKANRALGHRGARVTRAALVIGQTALSLTLLVLAGLLVMSLLRLGSVRLGFTPDGLVTASNRISRALRPWRTAMMLFLAIGGVGLLLATVGLYSVVSYLASDRLPEFGVRVVLGATGADVLKLVLIDGARLAAVGGCVGLLGAALAARYLGTQLFEVSPFELVTYLVALSCLAVAALTAMWFPARRAAR